MYHDSLEKYNQLKYERQKINKRLLEFFIAHYKPGVIGLVGTKDAIGLAIRAAQKEMTEDGRASLWSHCFICGELRLDRRGEKNNVTKSPYIFESDLDIKPFKLQLSIGAQENWIGKWCGENIEHAAVIDFSLSNDEKDCVLATALQLVDDQVIYPVQELLGTWFAILMHKQWLPNPLDTPHALYCSAFVRHCYREALRDFLSGEVHISNTTPEDIARAGCKAGALSVFNPKNAIDY